jgi:hypothetical protein
MKTIVNTDVKMPNKMLKALTLFETYCMCHEKKETNADEVKKFLKERFNEDLANSFNDKYLY